jgi:hypothetical protein
MMQGSSLCRIKMQKAMSGTGSILTQTSGSKRKNKSLVTPIEQSKMETSKLNVLIPEKGQLPRGSLCYGRKGDKRSIKEHI